MSRNDDMNANMSALGGKAMIEAGSDSLLNAQWARVRGRLRAEFGEATFRSWLKPLTLAGRRGRDLRVAVPSRFMRDWVATHYADRITALWSSECPEIRSVEVIVDARDAAECRRRSALDDALIETPVAGDASPAATPCRSVANANLAEADGLAEVSATLDPRLTFDNFVVGKSNELAHAAALRVAEIGCCAVQPAVSLWRRRPRQDPSDACDRPSHQEEAAARSG